MHTPVQRKMSLRDAQAARAYRKRYALFQRFLLCKQILYIDFTLA